MKSIVPVAFDTLSTFDAFHTLVKAGLRNVIVRFETSAGFMRLSVAVPVSVNVATVEEVFVSTAMRPAGTLVTV